MEKLQKIGEAAKNIRKSFELTIEESETETLKKSSLDRFEKGNDVKLSTLFAWLEKFDKSLEELLYASNNYELSGYQAILDKAKRTYGENQLIALKRQLDDAKWYASESKSKRDKLNYLILKNIISAHDRTFILDTREQNQIIKYLMSIQDWSNYELILCGNTINAFDIKQIVSLAKATISRSKRYQALLRNPKAIPDILINVANALVDKQDYAQATYFKNEAKKLLQPQDIYERTTIIFLEGIIEFYTGNQAVGKRKMEQALNVFEESESFGFVEMYKKKYDEIIKKSESL